MDSKQRRWSEDVKDILLLFKYALNLIKYSPAISPHVFLVLLTEITLNSEFMSIWMQDYSSQNQTKTTCEKV